MGLFLVCLAVIAARLVSLDINYGPAYRALAERPLEQTVVLPAVRGRILAADGTVLACDEPLASLAVRYRWLEEPANPDWLRRTARLRLDRSQRRDPAQVAAAEQQVLAERDDLHRRLAALCGLSLAEFRARAAAIQQRIERIGERVNERRVVQQTEGRQSDALPASRWQQMLGGVAEFFEPAESGELPARIAVAEELADHILCESLSLEAVAAISAEPWRYPGTRVVERTRRVYPFGSLAAHVIGYTSAASNEASSAVGPSAPVGVIGVERQYDALLAGKPGLGIEQLDHSGRRIGWRVERASQPGRDVVLSIDARLQREAESLLDAAVVLARRTSGDASAGGAVVVLQPQNGQVLAAASAPRFDIGKASQRQQMTAWLADAGRPLVDRPLKMAIPPGSVFKILSAIALLESNTIAADDMLHCRGYLNRPDRLRCLIYKTRGIGHGPVELSAALAQSCNVFFFHFAAESGPGPIVDWARRLGFGRPTGIDLPGETLGFVPSAVQRPPNRPVWNPADTQALAIGQSELLVTPLQVGRLIAAVANGGMLVEPRVARTLALDETPDAADDVACLAPAVARRIEGLRPGTLEAVRPGLEAAVASPEGTAHRSVYLPEMAIAGKTGTAETGEGRADHAWMAAYLPAEAPRAVIVVALEHAGGGADAAGPIVKRLALAMQHLGYFGRSRLADTAGR